MCIPGPLAKPLIFLTVFVAVSVTAGGVAVNAASIGPATADAAVSPPFCQGHQRQERCAQGSVQQAWLRMGLRSTSRQVRSDPGCMAYSFGQVRECFLTDPCLGLQRSLIELSDEKGRGITVSVAWVRMPSSVSARHLKRLVDRPGTGNLSPIADEVGVQFTGKHYSSRRTGSVVVIAEAATGNSLPDVAVLDGVAEVAAEFPSP